MGTRLAIVERALDGEVVYVCVSDSRHLSLLYGRHAPFGMEDED